MPYQSPTLSQLIQQGEQQFLSRFPDLKRHSVISVLNRVNAALSAGEHKHLDWLAKQIIPTTADEDYLLDYCMYKGVFRKPAIAATGIIRIEAVDAAEIPKGTTWHDSRTELSFIATATQQIDAGTAEIAVQCEAVGNQGNVAVNTQVSLTNAILNVKPKATIIQMSGGADLESLSSLLSRLIQRVQYPPAGGASHDYVRWALEVSGITRAWCFPRYYGGGTVGVAIVLDEQADILPTSQDCERVKNYISGHKNSVTGLWEGMPANVELFVFAPKVRRLDLTIRLMPNTDAVQSAVKSALVSLFRGLPPGGLLYLSHLRACISNVVTEIDNSLLSVQSDIQLAPDEILVLGEIQWQA
ncbi:baseplate J/gp47 family protein [Avibacterium paragallinarum]|uniref:baseplate J/gp47 family protein n=1 Tax=Avibacterium paragallinarum TaxID=728 RepID=UPI0021F7A352|nr:baseplate J/gp47 family protein [Avibacterium paragallinarum]UXN37833.1 baseplate J/gp47 family protein [Avibacterium paragallinarum]